MERSAGDGAVDIRDVLGVLMQLVGDGGRLPDPIVERGVDPTEDGRGCASGAGACG